MNTVSAPVAPPSLLNYRLQIDHLLVLLQSRSIMGCKCISIFAGSQPPSVSLNWHHCSLQVHTIGTASKCISKLAQSRPPSASPNSLVHSLQMYPQPGTITASKFTRSWPPGASPNWLDYCLQGYLQTSTITASERIFKFTPSQCGEMVKLDGRQPNINTLPHLAWYLIGIRQI